LRKRSECIYKNFEQCVDLSEQSTSLDKRDSIIQTDGNDARIRVQAQVQRRRRVRSVHYYLARDALSLIVDLGRKMDFGAVIREFNLWRESCAKKYVHLCRFGGGKDLHVFVRRYSRFDEDYVVPLRRRLKKLDGVAWDLKIELTVDPKRSIRVCSEFVSINRAWNKLRSWLRRRYGDFEFLRVLEVTKAGRPHLHVLIAGIKWIPQSELSQVWYSYGGGRVVYVRRIRGASIKARAYVLKYVNKTLGKGEKLYSALLFATNCRLYGMSVGCRRLVWGNGGRGSNVGDRAKVRKGFVFLGSVSAMDLLEFCEKKRIEAGGYVVVEVGPSDYWQFPYLFGIDFSLVNYV